MTALSSDKSTMISFYSLKKPVKQFSLKKINLEGFNDGHMEAIKRITQDEDFKKYEVKNENDEIFFVSYLLRYPVDQKQQWGIMERENLNWRRMSPGNMKREEAEKILNWREPRPGNVEQQWEEAEKILSWREMSPGVYKYHGIEYRGENTITAGR